LAKQASSTPTTRPDATFSDCRGTAAADRIPAGAGNDIVYGLAVADTIAGGAGNDQIDGGSGNDRVSGGGGNDLIIGGTGNDTIYAGDGLRDVCGAAPSYALDQIEGPDTP
jgi:Ca2+-binding RTX toxin-like protein